MMSHFIDMEGNVTGRQKRESVPNEVAAEVLFCSDRTCCVCREKHKPVQIHHIDGNTGNNSIDNLAVLCFDCHRDTQIAGGFDRKLDVHQIRRYRDDWYAHTGRAPASQPQLELTFCEMQSIEWGSESSRIAVKVVNKGEKELHIRQVSLSFNADTEGSGHSTRVLLDLTPSATDPPDGLIAPKQPINEHDPSPHWQRYYFLYDERSSSMTKMLLRLVASAERSPFVLEVWATERADTPVWRAADSELAGLKVLIEAWWDKVKANHPAYPALRKMLGLRSPAVFRSRQELTALAAKAGFRDTTEGDQDALWLSNFRRLGGPVHIRVDGSLFDENGELIPMLADEWRPELVQGQAADAQRKVDDDASGYEW